MKKNFFKIIILLAFISAGTTQAATLSFDPQETTLGPDQPFSVGLLVDAETSINAMTVEIKVPKNLEVVDISDGNSIINFWIDKPTYNAKTGIFSFAGMIPGGFVGNGGRLLIVTFKANALGNAPLAYDLKNTHLYQNTPTPTEEPTTAKSVALTIVKGRDNLANVIPDTKAPEPFTPYLVKLPSNEWAVVFQTQDKGSGIARFEIGEAKASSTRLGDLAWQEAESPYILSDQQLHSVIYVKAVDKKGNEQIASLGSQYPLSWLSRTWHYIAIVAGLILAALFIYAKKKSYSRTRTS
ncbi:MAG: hypothetical protein K0S38_647 [Candidatus Paceibacter sp.]|jgi:hypothetical protein|nr:hypothetical protein [Candidatus Paceibacter sp.]